MKINIGNIKIKNKINIGNIKLSVKKVYPELEDIEITPSTKDKVYKSENYYGYNEVTVKGVEGATEDLSAELTEQDNLITEQEITIEDIATLLEDKRAGGEISLQEKSVSPTTSEQLVLADNEYDGLSKVTVNAVTNEIDENIQANNIRSGVSILGVEGTLESGIKPSGEISITENGEYNVAIYEKANVNVPKDNAEYFNYLNGEMTEFVLPNGTHSIPAHMFYGNTTIEKADLSNVTKSIGSEAFRGTTNLKEVIMPTTPGMSNTIMGRAFYGCTSLTYIYFYPKNTAAYFIYSGTLAIFSGCTSLKEAYIPNTQFSGTNQMFSGCTSLEKVTCRGQINGQKNFENCTSLTALIFTTDKIETLNNLNNFTNTPIESGTGYIYVKKALIEDYKTATNWSIFANQFRAIEDYPEICERGVMYE